MLLSMGAGLRKRKAKRKDCFYIVNQQFASRQTYVGPIYDENDYKHRVMMTLIRPDLLAFVLDIKENNVIWEHYDE